LFIILVPSIEKKLTCFSLAARICIYKIRALENVRENPSFVFKYRWRIYTWLLESQDNFCKSPRISRIILLIGKESILGLKNTHNLNSVFFLIIQPYLAKKVII